MPHVVEDVEAGIVDPDRLPLDRGPCEPLPIARDEMQPRRHELPDHVDVDAAIGLPQRTRIEDRHATDVHVGIVVLERQHAGVEAGEALVAAVHHTPPSLLRARRTPGSPWSLPSGWPEA